MGLMSYFAPNTPAKEPSIPQPPPPDEDEEKRFGRRRTRRQSSIQISQGEVPHGMVEITPAAQTGFDRQAIRESIRQSKAVQAVDADVVPSLPSSRAASTRAASPAPSKKSTGRNEMNDIKCDVMVNYLHQQQEERLWTSRSVEEGVVLKKSRGVYTCCPAELADQSHGFLEAVELLNVKVSMPRTAV